ncbi:poly-gamma-glutamate hydrolase family protein [Bacillus sp. CGMCC 1.60114]|uniref:poly-gamma-glutamate hydrolase family protein n=1 Tax=unclassified Bacillus (in: firmicutes) TaxID=185979 RepID=UPI003637D7F6
MKKFMLALTSLFTASAFSMSTVSAASDTSEASDIYKNFAELSAHYQKGIDYTIETQDIPNSDVIILAIHGGEIEFGTDQIAKKIALGDYSYYIFNAKKKEDSNGDERNDLHLTSTHYDDPLALKMTAQKSKVVSIHGAKGTEKLVYMGGLDEELKTKISNKLSSAGFSIGTTPDNLKGTSPENIVNKGKNLKGAQLELTYDLRTELTNDSSKMKKFSDAIRSAIAESQ